MTRPWRPLPRIAFLFLLALLLPLRGLLAAGLGCAAHAGPPLALASGPGMAPPYTTLADSPLPCHGPNPPGAVHTAGPQPGPEPSATAGDPLGPGCLHCAAVCHAAALPAPRPPSAAPAPALPVAFPAPTLPALGLLPAPQERPPRAT